MSNQSELNQLCKALLPVINEIYLSQDDDDILYSHNNTSFIQQLALGIVISLASDCIKDNVIPFIDSILPVIEKEGLTTTNEQRYQLFSVATNLKFNAILSKREWDNIIEETRED